MQNIICYQKDNTSCGKKIFFQIGSNEKVFSISKKHSELITQK